VIEAKIRKQGNSFVVTIPREKMEHYHLAEGDEIAFAPSKVERRYAIRPELRSLVARIVEEHREALEYLAER
jgi:putative addiction module antidote